MAEEFVQIFTEMGWVSGICLTVGIVFCFIEIFIPGLGFFGITGGIATVVGLIARFVEGISLSQLLLLILMLAGVFAFGVCCLIVLVKIGALSDNGLFNTGTALPRDYGNSKEYRKLIGKIGKTTTQLGLAGRVKVRGKIYDAISQDSFIDKNKYVKIVRLEDNRLVVRRFWE